MSDRTPDQAVVQSVGAELAAFIDQYADPLRAQLSPDPYNPGSLAYIYHSKLDDRLVDLLTSTGLGTYRRNEGDAPDEWLGVHQKVGQAYMTALASGMASGGGQSVVSDNPRFSIAGCGFPVRQLFANLIEDPNLDATDAANRPRARSEPPPSPAVLPKNLDAVPIEKIIEFRKRDRPPAGELPQGDRRRDRRPGDVTDEDALREHLEYGENRSTPRSRISSTR